MFNFISQSLLRPPLPPFEKFLRLKPIDFCLVCPVINSLSVEVTNDKSRWPDLGFGKLNNLC